MKHYLLSPVMNTWCLCTWCLFECFLSLLCRNEILFCSTQQMNQRTAISKWPKCTIKYLNNWSHRPMTFPKLGKIPTNTWSAIHSEGKKWILLYTVSSITLSLHCRLCLIAWARLIVMKSCVFIKISPCYSQRIQVEIFPGVQSVNTFKLIINSVNM